MKKMIALIVALTVTVVMVGCSEKVKNDTDAGAVRPTLVMDGKNFFADTMPVSELSEDYECMGELTEEEANNTDLVGCKYYANKYISSFDTFYVYQECGTPIDERTVDNGKRQWAYVKWTREGFTAGNGEPAAGGADMPDVEHSDTKMETEQTQQAVTEDETIVYKGKKYSRLEVSAATWEWLQLSDEKRGLSSYYPPEFAENTVIIVESVNSEKNAVLSEEDTITIMEFLNGMEWNTEGTSDCASDCRLEVNGKKFKYHSECGTFNDNDKQKHLELDKETKEIVNAVLTEYIPLCSIEVPVDFSETDKTQNSIDTEDSDMTGIGYIQGIHNERVSFDEIEWVTVPSKRATELGITDEAAPSGFYIHNEESVTTEYAISDMCTIDVLDWEKNFEPKQVEFDDFIILLEQREGILIPYILTMENDKVIRIEEHYIP